jgi:TPP-dependent indolepyruvate ferredoxin oxidoreductase alpha subunit
MSTKFSGYTRSKLAQMLEDALYSKEYLSQSFSENTINEFSDDCEKQLNIIREGVYSQSYLDVIDALKELDNLVSSKKQEMLEMIKVLISFED